MNTKLLLFIVASFCSICVDAIGSGNYITITEAPYYVAIDDKQYKQILKSNFCGGSILSQYWVVTAAHCADNFSRKPMRTRSGGTTQTGRGEYHIVEKIIIHPDYEDSLNELGSPISHSDIALLKLATPISFSNYQQPIHLSNKIPKINDTVVLVGLGLEGVTADTISLKKAVMKVDELDDLDARWIPTFITVIDEYSAACAGDSGGPVVSDNKLIGILVMASGCRNWDSRFDTKFNFITPIYKYYDWIIEHTGLSY